MCLSFFKRKLERKMFLRMERQYRLAQLCIATRLSMELTESMGLDHAGLWAAAVTNDLFGQPPNEISIANLNMDEVKQFGDELLKSNLADRELVVQSLRVWNTIYVWKNNCLPDPFDRYEDILGTYGKEFPQVPNPTVYQSLIRRTLQSLPPRIQAQMRDSRFWQ